MTAAPIARATSVPTGAMPATEAKLRPTRLSEIVGQDEAIGVIEQAVAGAKARGDMPAPILLMGPPGTGKTTIAGAIANELGGRLVELFGVNLRYPRDITSPLAMSRPRDTVIIDEIHRVSRPVQEIMYTAFEDSRLFVGDRLRDTWKQLPPLTFVGATTDPQRLTEPMLDRFRLKILLAPYTVDGLVSVAKRAAGALGVGITDAAARIIAEHGQGTPRVVINIVWAARDWAQPITDDPSPTAKWFGDNPADSPINLSVHVGKRSFFGQGSMGSEGEQLAEHAVPGTRWITSASVREILESPALVWRVDGRDAG